MGKVGWIGLILVFTLSLAACASQGVPATGAAANKGPLSQDYENALSPLGQLVVGMFRLEGTSQAVSKTQATGLLPLWKAYRSLSASQSVSPLEMQGLIKQLQDNMTREQLEAIANMRLTRDDMSALMQKQGLADAAGTQTGAQTSQQSAVRQTSRIASGGPGAPPAGGPMPGGPMGAPMGGQSSVSQQSALQQVQRAAGASAALPNALLDVLIKLLESKI